MELHVESYSIAKKGMEAIDFCKKYDLEPKEVIYIKLNDSYKFSIEEVQKSKCLQKLFVDRSYLELDMKEKFVEDHIDSFGFKKSENDEAFVYVVLEKTDMVQLIEDTLNNLDNLEIEYPYIDKENVQNIENEIESISCKYINNNKRDVTSMLNDKDEIINKLKQQKTKSLHTVYLDMNCLFKNHEYVLFYIYKGIPEIYWSSGCKATGKFDILKKIHEIERRYISVDKSSEDLKVAEDYLNKIEMLMNSEFISDDFDTETIKKELENKKDVLKRRKEIQEQFDKIKQEDYNKQEDDNYNKQEDDNIIFTSIMKLLEKRKEKILEIIEEDNDPVYTPKNKLWLDVAIDAPLDSFKYLIGDYERSSDDDYYYDLVAVNYLNKYFALPVPILAKWLDITEEDIFMGIFNGNGYFKSSIDFI